jgi:toxin ParE1/3/4
MTVVFSSAAEQDLSDLFSYIRDELQNPIAAHNIAAKILQRSQQLATFPEIGASLYGIDQRLDGYRYLLVDNYLVIYSITDEQVAILRILYARSDYMQLLKG